MKSASIMQIPLMTAIFIQAKPPQTHRENFYKCSSAVLKKILDKLTLF
jgi:hypothetical protein